ncbi:MAG: alpha/beta fold hydrolase [Planctomycetaceae bacterium]
MKHLRFLLMFLLLTSARLAGAQLTAVSHQDPLLVKDADGESRRIVSPEEWQLRRRMILDGMQEAMGPLPDVTGLAEFDLQVTDRTDGPGWSRRTITFATRDGDRIPADLYLPSSDEPLADRSRPAVLALHPTGPLGKRIVAGDGPLPNRQYAVELAQRGYVVLAPDYPSFGDYPYDFENDAYVSGTMKGITGHMRCVDLLTSEIASVDPNRIGVIGHSLGGHNAMFLGAFDPRVKVIVSSCGWTPFHDYYEGNITGWTSARYMPLLKDRFLLKPDALPFDFAEVIGALAPRPFFSSSPLEDSNFAVDGVRKAIPRAREVYDLFDAGSRLQVEYPHCEHDFPTETRLRAYTFIDEALGHKATTGISYSAELPRIAPLEPDEALKTFEVADGFEIQQTAAEPLITDPVAMSFDERGRLFVVEMKDYSEQDTERLGQIRLLEDTDDDGVFDRSTVFARGLSWPTAIICSRGGIYVGAAPDILFLKDTDNDQQADVSEVIFTGFQRSNIQGLLNSFQWGIDNRIHGATSSSGGLVRRPDQPESAAVNLRGRDFSFDPKTHDLRAEPGGAQHGLSFADFGRKFVCSNSDHAQFIVYDDTYFSGRSDVIPPPVRISIADDGGQAPVFRSSPVEPWRIVRTRLRVSGAASGPVEGGGRAAGYFTGATGITIYRGDAWGEEFSGTAFIGDVGSNIVHRKQLIPKGVTYTATRIDQQSEFLRSRDIWFRPVQFSNAPDGSLHVLDMYREVIEHPKSLPPEIKQHLDLTSGRDRGRLYRIVRKGHPVRRSVDLSTATAPELIRLLDHPNSWHRETAARLLYENSETFGDPLQSLLSTAAVRAASPVGRVHSLHLLHRLNLLKAEHIATALRDATADVCEQALRLTPPFTAELVRSEALHPGFTDQPRVQLQLAFTAASFPDELRLEAVTGILTNSDWNQDPWIQSAALLALHTGAGQVFEDLVQRQPRISSAVLQNLARLIARQNHPDDLGKVITRLKSRTIDHNLQVAFVTELLTQRPAVRSELQSIVADIVATAAAVAQNDEASEADRMAAIDQLKLGSFSDRKDVFLKLMDRRQPASIRSRTLQTLGHFGTDAAPLILEHWSGLTPKLRTDAETALCSRTDSMLLLFQAIDDGKVSATEISPAQLQAAALQKDPRISRKAKELLQSASARVDAGLVREYQAALQQPGSSGNGRILFRKTCVTCHRLENEGRELGPSLAAIKNRGAEAILVNVLDPNREVNPQFLSYVVSTTDGRVASGMIQSETSTTLTLVHVDGKSTTIPRSDIDELKNTGLSLMPADLHKTISPAQLNDIITYLLAVE